LLNTKDSVARAIDLYRQALAADPDDARAWAGLSRAYATQAGYGYASVHEANRNAKAAAERALALDDNLAEAHDVMGWVYVSFEFRWDDAGKAFRKACALAPGDSRMLSGLAAYEVVCGRPDEANRLAQKAIELDPLNPQAHLFRGRIEMWSGRLDEAHESHSKALELSPGITSVHAINGVVYMLQGRLDEALVESKKEGSAGYRNCALAMVYHALGRALQSDEAMEALIQEGEQWGIQIALVHAYRGESDAAFEWLERSYTLRDSGIPGVRVNPVLTNLHDDPRWPKFLEKIGLTT
jgi:Tfp pilus assembly protein PilF